jgi:outer membrane protein TolC
MPSIPVCAGRYRLTLLVLLLLCTPVAPARAAAPLTFDASLQMAVARSRQLAGLDAAVSASRELAVAARQLPDPVVKFGLDNLPTSGAERLSVSADSMTMRRIGVMQEFTRAAKRDRRAELFQREADKALAEKGAASAAIARATAMAWLDSYFLREIAQRALEQVAQAEQEALASESAYRGGNGVLADVLAARGAALLARDAASQASRRSTTATTVLARWIGADAERALAPPPELDTVPLDAASLEAQLAKLPELDVLDRQLDAALAEVRSAEANRHSDWSVEVTFQQRGPAYANMVSIGASVPLQWDRRQRQDREVAAKLALAERARFERQEAQHAQLANIRVLLDEWHNGQARIARFERELLPLAAERAAAALAAFGGAKAPLTDVLAARRAQTELRAQALELRMETARLWAQLRFLFPRVKQGDPQ